MNPSQKVQELLHNLRAAIDQALADSFSVLAAMGELEDAGFCPSFCVDIALPDERELPTVELVTYQEGLILTASDESFLQALGITAPML